MAVSVSDVTNDPREISVKRLTHHFVGEVSNVDLSKSLSEEAFQKILSAFHEHSVIVFRGQNITPDQHVDFSRRFGEVEVHHLSDYTLPDHSEVFVLANIPVAGKPMASKGGQRWHSDMSYIAEPSLGSLLYGVECPTEGADTHFASMYAAYDALSADMEERLSGLRAVHDRVYNWERFYKHRPPLTDEQKAKVPPVEHPVVRTHPVTGRKALYISASLISHVIGMEEEEGRRLMEELVEFATQPEFTYAHKWSAGDLVFWDNRCTMHKATSFDEEKYRRVMYRTTIKGDRPF